jgi:hypothetical protein
VFAMAAAAEPVITGELATASPKSGWPFQVEYRVEWPGAPEDFAIVPSDPAPVAWGTARILGARSSTTSDGQAVTYAVEYVAERPGTYEVPPFRLAYVPGGDVFAPPVEYTPATTSRVANQPETTPPEDLEPVPLEAGPIDVRVSRYIPPAVIAGIAAVALALVAIAGAVVWRFRRAGSQGEEAAPGATTVQSVLNLAKQHRLDGKFYDYYRALAQAATLAAPSIGARKLREKLEKDAQRVGYGALQPSEDELEGAMRDLERVMREPAATKSED